MNKAELVQVVAKKSGNTQVQVNRILTEILSAIIEEVGKGGEIRLIGFGTFSPSYRQPRAARNPKTGEEMVVEGRVVPKFSSGQEFKNAVKHLANNEGS